MILIVLRFSSRLAECKKIPDSYRNNYVDAENFRSVAKEIRRYIDLNLCNIKSTAEIAARFGVTERTLFGKFKAEFGISPHKYIQDEKLMCSKRLLLETDELWR